jgi:NAD(P)-dependent dehydrogenase (short-subunit alcohol dehydrogenase family)
MVARAVNEYGRLDLAANVAGVPQGPVPLEETTLELWDRTHAVNDRGLFLCLQAEIWAMLDAGGGAVVNVSSLNGLRSFAQMTACGSSKFGAVSTTMTVAAEFSGRNIRVNAYSARIHRHSAAVGAAGRDAGAIRRDPPDPPPRDSRRGRQRHHLPAVRRGLPRLRRGHSR